MTINDMRRMRSRKEFTPLDTDELGEVIRLVLQLTTDDEFERLEEANGFVLPYQIRTATVPGVKQASFAPERMRFPLQAEDLNLDDDRIIL